LLQRVGVGTVSRWEKCISDVCLWHER
jgi:hypothetical protein